jgi:hypothetical protein
LVEEKGFPKERTEQMNNKGNHRMSGAQILPEYPGYGARGAGWDAASRLGCSSTAQLIARYHFALLAG